MGRCCILKRDCFPPEKQVKIFLNKVPFAYTILPGAEEVIRDWKVNFYPTNFVIDQKGMVQFRKAGFDQHIGDSLALAMDALLKEEEGGNMMIRPFAICTSEE